MLKFCLMLVFVCCGSCLFSEDSVIDIEDESVVAEDWEAQLVEEVYQGLASIVAGDLWRASTQFENAEAILAEFDPGSPAHTFIISCGQAIVFDCLGLGTECGEACIRISSSFLADDEDTEDDDDDDMLTEEEQEESERFFEMFAKAARLSPTKEVRDFLCLIISFFEDEE